MAPAASAQVAFPFSLPYKVEAPCEYCLDPIVVCARVEARAEDDHDAPVVAVLEAGDSLSLIGGRTHVVTPDIIVFSDTLRFAAADPYTRSLRSIVFQPGDTVYVLTYGSEGDEGEWWYRGRVIRSENAWMDRENLERVAWPRKDVATSLGTRVTQRWMKVRNADGVEGWLENDRRSVTYGNYYDPEIRPCPEELE